MDELIGLLTRERLLLERLLFRCVELRMLLGTEPRFVAWASTDVNNAASALRDAELRRAVLYSSIAEANRWPSDQFDWARLEAAAGEPGATILREVHSELAALTGELQGQLAAIRNIGESGLAGVTEFLESLGSPEDLINTAMRREPNAGASPWTQSSPTTRVDRTL